MGVVSKINDKTDQFLRELLMRRAAKRINETDMRVAILLWTDHSDFGPAQSLIEKRTGIEKGNVSNSLRRLVLEEVYVLTREHTSKHSACYYPHPSMLKDIEEDPQPKFASTSERIAYKAKELGFGQDNPDPTLPLDHPIFSEKPDPEDDADDEILDSEDTLDDDEGNSPF